MMTGVPDPEATTRMAEAKMEKAKAAGSASTTMVRQIKDVGSAQFPMLTRTNYAEWSTILKVMLRSQGLWAADEQEDLLAMEAILKAVPLELVTPLGSADDAMTKKAWEKLKMMQLGDKRIREAKA